MKSVVFVCMENSCRSQLAHAFAQIHNPGDFEFYSAGSQPSGRINDKAVEVMAERDYDLTSHHSKSLDEIPDITYDAVITMGCGDDCPWIRGALREDWQLDDPKHYPLDRFREIRNEIEKRVMELIDRLGRA